MDRPTNAPLAVLAMVVLGVSLVGFLRGTRQAEYAFEVPLRDLPEADHAGVQPALPYWGLRERVSGGAEPVLTADLATLVAAVPSRTDVVELGQGGKQNALAERSARRAYFGAPPIIPHPIQQQSQAECRACHELGVRIRGRVAPPYPHDAFVSCTQCHPQAAPALPWDPAGEADPRAVPNSFDGARAPLQGKRWTGIAPPSMPHPTFMHERCISCHGPNGRDAMKSTHPERQSCLQCHVTDANLEARP